MRGAFLSMFIIAGLSAVLAYPLPQQQALPPHLLRQYLAQNQQDRPAQEATPIFEQDSRTNAQPQYIQRAQAVQYQAQFPQQVVPQPQLFSTPAQLQAQALPEYRPRVQGLRPRPRPQVPSEDLQQITPEDNGDDDPNIAYQFGFDVNDDQFTNYQNRKEERQGGVIKGSYSVVDSDGFIRTVTYTADPKEGFKAEVVRKPTDIVVKIPTPPPPREAAPVQRHQQPLQYADASSQVPARTQNQYYDRYQ